MEDIALAHKALFVAKEGAGIKNAWEALSSRHRSPDKNLTPPKLRQVRFFYCPGRIVISKGRKTLLKSWRKIKNNAIFAINICLSFLQYGNFMNQ